MKRTFLLIPILLLAAGCATAYLKGFTPDGQKVYLPGFPIEETEAYRIYSESQKEEIDKIRYLFKRVVAAKDLVYHRDGKRYNWLEAYRAGMWLMRNRLKPGISARDFMKTHIWRSEAGRPHLVEFPDGSVHVGYYILLNELELIESRFPQSPA